MSKFFWDQLNIIAGYFAIAVVFALAILSAHLEIKDLDLWLHLRTGQVISQQLVVPAQDIYSATIGGKPWVNHEWLFQVIVAKVHALSGFDGLIMMQVVVVTTTLLILLLAFYRRDRQGLIVASLLLIMLIYQSRLTIRPDIFSILFLTIFLILLSKYTHRWWAFIVMVGVQLCWVNMHGFFFMGPLLVWLSILGCCLNTWIRKERMDLGWLPMAAWILPLITILNPLGLKGALYPVTILMHLNNDANIFFQHIVELARPITADNILTQENSYYKLMIILSVYAIILNRKYLDFRIILIWLFFLLFSLVAVRNLIFFGIVGAWALIQNTSRLTFEGITPMRFIDERFKFITAIIIKIALIGWMINVCAGIFNHGYFDFDTYERKSELEGVSKRNFPYKAVDFLVANQVKGNFFNDFNTGSYLIGRASPNIKVFIDGRTEQYGSKFFEEYQKIWRKGDRRIFEQFAKRFNITGAFLNSNNQDIPSKAARMFYRLKGWHVVYFDDDALILLKDVPANAALIKKYSINLEQWTSRSMNLQRLGTKRVAPFTFVNRATTLFSIGLNQQAISELKNALMVSPDYAPAYHLLGKIYLANREYKKAFNQLRIASMLDPSFRDTRRLLAESYEGIKDYKGALKQYERLYNSNPENARTLLGLVRSYIGLGEYNHAIEKYRLINPQDMHVADYVRLGDMFFSKHEYKHAQQIYVDALKKKKNIDALNYRIGLTYLRTGDTITARKFFQEGLVINPKHKGIKKALNSMKQK